MKTLQKYMLLILLTLGAGTAAAQTQMKVETTTGDSEVIDLERLSRITFSADESVMLITTTDGQRTAVLTDELYTITFLAPSPTDAIATVSQSEESLTMSLSAGILQISAPSAIREVTVYDASGRKLTSVKGAGTSRSARIPMSSINTGTRIVKVTTERSTTTRKFLVRK